MKRQFIKSIIALSAFLSLITTKGNAQAASDYYVLQMNAMVPIGEKMTLRLQFTDQDFHVQNGANTYFTGAPPTWSIVNEQFKAKVKIGKNNAGKK